MEAKPDMDMGAVYNWTGCAVQIASAGAIQLWPKQRAIGWALLAVGWVTFLIPVALYLFDHEMQLASWAFGLTGGLALPVLGAAFLIAKSGWPWGGSIALSEAAEEVFDQIRRNGRESALYGADLKPASMLKEIATFAIACDIPIYGLRLPMTKTRLISKGELRATDVNKGATALTSLDGREVLYENLRVKRADLRRLMPRLVAMTNHG